MTGLSSEWQTIQPRRRVLLVVRTTTTLTRLLDVVALIAVDRRIQVVFTVDESNAAILAGGMRSVLQSLDAVVMPWADAISTRFDLALAASENDDLSRIDAPLVLLPHGVGHQKFYPGTSTVSGLTPARVRDLAGDTTTVYALSHPDQVRRLAEVHPAAGRRGRVVGDPALGRMMANRHRASAYRTAYDAAGRALVVLASTWGPDSLLGGWPDLPEQLLAELPADEYRLVAVLHPGIWAHGPWQVRAWWSRAAEYGLRIVPPVRGWQAALLGASCVVSDAGSLGLYAAALDKPVLLAPYDSATTVPGSAAQLLGQRAPRLDRRSELREQIDATMTGHVRGRYDEIISYAVDEPERTAQRLRSLLYELMRLDEPADVAEFPAVPVPAREPLPATTMIVGAEASDTGITIVRYPGLGGNETRPGLDYRHLVADVDRARLDQVAAAGILCSGTVDAEGAAELLRQWPRADIIAAGHGPDACRITTRSAELLVRGRPGIDVRVLASWAYVRLHRDGTVPGRDRLRLGDRVIDVVVEAG
ncbi:hypothetical protein [Actinoplanes sp. NPDC051494]|uniref:hypothetical protein n=1 Tax=Actinoplanes sp. NPDC051494 TaxID=3363907 RepID=UPI0037A4D66F